MGTGGGIRIDGLLSSCYDLPIGFFLREDDDTDDVSDDVMLVALVLVPQPGPIGVSLPPMMLSPRYDRRLSPVVVPS